MSRSSRRSPGHPPRRSPGRSIVALLLLLCLARSAAAETELRVLLGFDADGHRVHRVLRRESVPALGAPEPGRVPPASSGVQASLTWLDAAGRTLAATRAPDPRVGHTPAHGAYAPAERRIALESGGWLVHGPGEAATLLLELPPRADLMLPAERWRLVLR